jgi:hypothetical protein
LDHWQRIEAAFTAARDPSHNINRTGMPGPYAIYDYPVFWARAIRLAEGFPTAGTELPGIWPNRLENRGRRAFPDQRLPAEPRSRLARWPTRHLGDVRRVVPAATPTSTFQKQRVLVVRRRRARGRRAHSIECACPAKHGHTDLWRWQPIHLISGRRTHEKSKSVPGSGCSKVSAAIPMKTAKNPAKSAKNLRFDALDSAREHH